MGFVVAVLLPRPAHAGESRHYDVVFRGQHIGTSLLAVRDDPGGIVTYVHHSRLETTRDGVTAWSVIHEEVRIRDGVFLSAWAIKEQGGVRHVVTAHWDPRAGVVVVDRDGQVSRVPTGSPAGLETLFDAPRRLVENGAVGARRRVFDMPEAKVGWAVLVKARDKDGWAETRELGIRVRTRWAPGARLPDVLQLADLGMVYRATSIATGDEAAAPEDLTGGGVRLVGKLAPGAKVRLVPAHDWPGLRCPASAVSIPASGPICPMGDQDLTRGPPLTAGPLTHELVRGIKGKSAMARALTLARRIDARLAGRPGGAALWQADPETALESGAGDCNEAAAVFMAAAPLVHLKARRRTGLVLDPSRPGLLWPHAWVEVRDGRKWVRVDPSRGEAPARGVYIDLGDGDLLAARVRAVAPTLHGDAKVIVVPANAPAPGSAPPSKAAGTAAPNQAAK